MTVLTEFAAGHVFEPLTFSLDPEAARAYTSATGDSLSLYESKSVAPPLAVAALALGVLLESVSLPPGSLHSNEAVRFLAPVPNQAMLECHARLAQRSVRGGWVVSVLESEIKLDGATVQTSRASVLSPAPS